MAHLAHTSRRNATALKPALSLAILLSSAHLALAADFTFTPTFETSKQSIFGTGTAAASIDKQAQFLGAQWNASITKEEGNPNGGNGFSLTAATSGRVGLEYGLKIDSGSIDASLPFDVKVSTPNANTLQLNQPFVVNTSATFRNTEGAFTTRSPTFQFYSDFVFEAQASLSGKASVDLFFLKKQIDIPTTNLIDIDVREELIAINRDNDGGIRVLPFLFSAASTAKDAYDSAEATKELKQEVDSVSKRREKVKIGLKKVGVSFSLESPLEASIRLPYIEMQGETVSGSLTKLSKSDKDGFAEFSFDLDRIASLVAPQIPPMTINADLDLVVGGISASATIFDIDFNPTVNLTQTAEVEAKNVKINFDFGRTIRAGIVPATGPVVYSNVSSLALDAGQQLSVIYDGQDVNLLPTYSVDAALKSQFGLSISSEIAYKALEASISASLFGLDLGGITLGPAFSGSVQFPDVSLGNLFDQTFALSGFNTVTGSPIFISDKPASFTGAAGTNNWSNPANWAVNGNPGIIPDIGRIAVIPDAITVFADSAPTNAAYHVSIGKNASLFVSNLSVGGNLYNQGLINVAGGGTLKLDVESVSEGAHSLVGGSVFMGPGAEMILVNNPADTIPDSRLAASRSSIRLENAGIYSQGGPGRLELADGTSIVATNEFNTAPLQSTIGTKDGWGLDIVKTGGAPVSITAATNAKLAIEFGSIAVNYPTVEPTPAELIAGNGTVPDMLNIVAGNGATITLKGSAQASNLNFRPDPGTVEDVRFVTTGTGVIKNVGTISLEASINEGKFVADGADNPGAGVNTIFVSVGSTTGEATPVVNNGTMTFISRPGAPSRVLIDGAGGGTLAGKGEMQLYAYGSPLQVTSASVTTTNLTNRAGHTIRMDNVVFRAPGYAGFSQLTNQGNLIADGDLGDHVSTVNIDLGSGVPLFNEGSGVISAKSSNLSIFASLRNFGTVAAGVSGVVDVQHYNTDSNLKNVGAPGNYELTGGTFSTELNGRIFLRTSGLVASEATSLVNKSNIAIASNYVAPTTAGIYFYRGTSQTTGLTSASVRLENLQSITNASVGTFRLAQSATFTTTNFQNFGYVDLSNSTLNGVVNNAGGIVAGAGNLRLNATSGTTATNAGSIVAMPAEGNIQLNVGASPGVTTLVNNGVFGAVGADLVFLPGLTVASSSPGTLSGGSWLVDGSTGPARIIVPTATANVSTLSNVSVTLEGAGASFQSKPASGGFLFDFKSTLTTIASGAVLTLENNTQAFTNRINIGAGGKLALNLGGTIATSGIDLTGQLFGNGTVNAPIVMKGGTLEARNGLLTLNQNVQNGVGGGSTPSFVGAYEPGAVLNPNNIRIDGGSIAISNYAAALYGTGTLAPANLSNAGTVAVANVNGNLRLTGNGAFFNSNLMTTRERGTLEFDTMTLNNTGGTISAIDTGGLDLQSDGGGIGGTIRLTSATINGGSVTISGANSTLRGYGTLSNVKLSVANAFVTAATPGGGVLAITPAANTIGNFYNSTVQAQDGGIVRLSGGTFEAVGSSVTATGTAGSYVELSNARLNGGRIITSGNGLFKIAGTSTLAATKNLGTVQVPAGQTLNLLDTIDNRGGTLDVRGTVNLDNVDVVGGNFEIKPNAIVYAKTRAQILGSNLVNTAQGTLYVMPVVGDLTINQSNDGTSSAGSFINNGTLISAGKLKVINQSFVNTGAIEITSSGNLNATALTQTAGFTRVNGTAQVANFYLNGGTLYGAGRITGNLISQGGIIAPGNSPGTLTVDGDIQADPDTNFDMQIADAFDYDRIVSTDGDIHLQGIINIDFSETPAEALGLFLAQSVTIDLFDVAPGRSIINEGVRFEVLGTTSPANLAFNPATGELSIQIPEPTALGLLALPAPAPPQKKKPLQS